MHSTRSSMLYDVVYYQKKFIFLGNKSLAIDVTFYPNELFYLPAPYGTKCVPMNFSSEGEMILKPIREKYMQKYPLVNTLAPVFIPYDYPMITRSRLRNETFVNLFRLEAEKAGNPLNPCRFKYTVTRADAYQAEYPWVSVYWPQNSRNDVSYVVE